MTTFQLPPAPFPAVTQVFTKRFGINENGEPMVWIVDEDHPLISGVKIVRMYIVDGGVEVYSVMPDGKHGMRETIPSFELRLMQEVMPAAVFLTELQAADAGVSAGADDDEEYEDDDDDDDEDEDPEDTQLGQRVGAPVRLAPPIDPPIVLPTIDPPQDPNGQTS